MVVNVGNPCQYHDLPTMAVLYMTLPTAKPFVHAKTNFILAVGNMHEKKLGTP